MAASGKTKILFRKFFAYLHRNRLNSSANIRHSSTSVTKQSVEGDDDEESIIEQQRNVSGLSVSLHRRITGEMPAIRTEYQRSRAYQRKLYGKYGNRSGVSPVIGWPSEEELEDMIKHQTECEPNLMDMVAEVERKKKEQDDLKTQRQAEVEKNMQQMPIWIKEFHKKQEVIENEKKKLEKKRQEELDEISEHFGYFVDKGDAKVQAFIEQKQEEKKLLEKKMKKEKRKMNIENKIQALADKMKEKSS